MRSITIPNKINIEIGSSINIGSDISLSTPVDYRNTVWVPQRSLYNSKPLYYCVAKNAYAFFNSTYSKWVISSYISEFSASSIWDFQLNSSANTLPTSGTWESFIATETITTTGSGTWIVSSDFIKLLKVECWGGGGGGGGKYYVSSTNSYRGGAGGAGGGYARKTIWASQPSVGDTISYSVGQGGTKGSSYSSGGSGGATTWGNNLVIANGGQGGVYNSSVYPPTSIGGVFNSSGQIGDVTYSGGNGYKDLWSSYVPAPYGGPGGGGAGNAGNGGNAGSSASSSGSGGSGGGGSGGMGYYFNDGAGYAYSTYGAGNFPGGGGGGCYYQSSYSPFSDIGNSGGAGKITITYIKRPNTQFSVILTNESSWTSPIYGKVLVECWGAGGGGQASYSTGSTIYSGGGGGGGSYSASEIDVSIDHVYPISIGTGGSGGTSLVSAGSGGDTSFDETSIIAKGGGGGFHDANIFYPNGGGTGGEGRLGTGTLRKNGGDGANSISREDGGETLPGVGGGGSAGYSNSYTYRHGVDGRTPTDYQGIAVDNGGIGGNGGSIGSNGNSPASGFGGGGGSGSLNQNGTYFNGGAGANGKIVITYPSPGILASPIFSSQFKMNAYSGSSVVLDTNGSRNISTASPTFSAEGKIKWSMYFDSSTPQVKSLNSGSSPYINLLSGVSSGAISICTWIYIDSFSNNDGNIQIIRRENTSSGLIELNINSSSKKMYYAFASSYQGSYSETITLNGSHTLSTGTWYHVCATFSSNGLFGYVNGEADGSTNSKRLPLFTSTGGDVYIGSGGTTYTNRKLLGRLDDFRVYNLALTSSQIAVIYNNGLGGEGY